LAHGLGVPLVGSIPLHPDLAAGGDAGVPVALAPDGDLSTVFADMARVVAEEVAPLIQAEGCTARMLERVEAAVAQGEAEAG
jgi:septum formation inhibitor-activating ATPase MinD